MILDHPFLVFAVSFVAQWLASYVGDVVRRRGRALGADEREDFDIVRTATFTLLALLIAFSFSMAVSRYDQRKNYEAAEANAIGTEYARADLLPAEQAEAVRALLRAYLDERIAFYLAREQREEQLHAATIKLQADLWAAVAQVGARQPTPMTALAVAGMNDVLNAEAYTNASWRNRIPFSAWILMGLIAICCNFMIGYGERRTSPVMIVVLPVVISISLFLVADIDSPRRGIINVVPHNLMFLVQLIDPVQPRQ